MPRVKRNFNIMILQILTTCHVAICFQVGAVESPGTMGGERGQGYLTATPTAWLGQQVLVGAINSAELLKYFHPP